MLIFNILYQYLIMAKAKPEHSGLHWNNDEGVAWVYLIKNRIYTMTKSAKIVKLKNYSHVLKKLSCVNTDI